MALFNFSKAERDNIVPKIQDYVANKLDQEIGEFDAGFLLDFFAEEIGPFFYNKGIQDANTILHKRLEDITEAIESLEKPVIARKRK
jgi:uncharacterized protein (DUF2164 family)